MQVYGDNPILDRTIFAREWDPSPQGQKRWHELVDNLKQQVGDFTSANADPKSRADAMYRLARVLNHIDNDPSVPRSGTSRPGDGFLDRGADERNSEFGRLEAFAKGGYPALQNRATAAPTLQPDGRAPGDDRTAEEIVVNPLFRELGRVLEPRELTNFKKHVGGDWEDLSLPAGLRADSAANAERVLEYIDKRGGIDSEPNNGEIEGVATRIAYIAPPFDRLFRTYEGSEARLLMDFAYDGYSVFD
jgi:hypothetical protein